MDLDRIVWSEEECSKDYAIQNLEKKSEWSEHVVRLKTQEKPHIHAEHDLSVMLAKGCVTIHFKGRDVVLEEGEAVEIPMKAFHWAENLSAEPSLLQAKFSPPFDGKDTIFV